MSTWNGDARLFDDYEFGVLMFKRGSNPGDHCFLVPSIDFWSHWSGKEHLRMAGDLDRFAVGLEKILEYLKTKMGIRRPQEEKMAFKKNIHEIKRARNESKTSWINRSDEALMDMRKKLASARGTNSPESTMIPPQIPGWLPHHRARLRDQDIVGVMTMTGSSLNLKLVEKSLLDLFTDDLLQSVDRSHGKDSGNPRKQHASEAIEEIPESDDETHLNDDHRDDDDPYVDEDVNFLATEDVVPDVDHDFAIDDEEYHEALLGGSRDTRPHEASSCCSWMLSCCCPHPFRQAYRQRKR